MCKIVLAVIGSGLVLGLCAAARAADERKVVEMGKQATALVVMPSEKGFGSAFCIDTRGLFITNAHVVEGLEKNETVTLVLNSGEENQRQLRARVLTADEKWDLALLKTLPAEGLVALPLGDVKQVYETMPVTAFGYPFGNLLAVKEGAFPSMTINVARVTAIRRDKGEHLVIQLDSQLNPGNSGGPVIDGKGNVIGIVSSGVLGAGINFAIPVSALQSLMETPRLVLDPPVVEFADRHKPMELKLHMISFAASQPRYVVKIALQREGEQPRVIEARPTGGGNYLAQAVLVPPPTGAAQVSVTIGYAGGSMQTNISDRPVRLDTATYQLSELRRIEQTDDGFMLETRDGDEVTGNKLLMPPLRIELAGQAMTISAESLKSMTIADPTVDTSPIAYKVTAEVDEKVVAEIAGKIEFSDVETVAEDAADPAQAPAQARRPGELPRAPRQEARSPDRLPRGEPEFDGDKAVVRLPEKHNSWTLGGGGRYLIFHLKQSKTVAILDLLKAKIVHEIPNVPDDVLLAAGASKLMLVMPGQKMMQRWDLGKFAREATAALPGTGTTYLACMGANSNGPLLVCAEDAQLIDIQRMRPYEILGDIVGGAGEGGRYQQAVRASARGDTFGAILLPLSPSQYKLMRIHDNLLTVQGFGSTSMRMRWAQPNADGSLVFVRHAIYSGALQELPTSWLNDAITYPTVDSRYFIAVRIGGDSAAADSPQIMVCTTADRRLIHTYTGMEEMAPPGRGNERNAHITRFQEGQERFHYIPWAGLLVGVHWDDEQIILHRFNLLDALTSAGVDYLFVESVPPFQATKGQSFSYPLQVQSKAGGLKYRLESGPKGMRISAGGIVQWTVPLEYPEQTAKVIVSISDASQQEILHSFDLAIQTRPRRGR